MTPPPQPEDSASLSAHFKDFLRQIESNLAPISTALSVGGTLWAVLDFLSPWLGVTGLLLMAGLLAAGAVLCFTKAPVSPAQKRLRGMAAAVLLALVSVGTASATFRIDEGGWIASQSPAARSVQEQLLGLSKQVEQVQRGVDDANRTLERIDERTALIAGQNMSCPRFSCLLIDGAPIEQFEALQQQGVPLETEADALPLLLETRLPNRVAIIDFYLKHGVPADINEPFLTMSGPTLFTGKVPAARKPLADRMTAAVMAQLKLDSSRRGDAVALLKLCEETPIERPPSRWLDAAVMSGDLDMAKALIERGANPQLPIPVCQGVASALNSWSHLDEGGGFRALLARAPALSVTASTLMAGN